MSKDEKKLVKIKLTKLDVALRQLSEAIHLFFEERDSVSIHTLAMASYQILYDIAKKRKIKDLMYDSIVIKDEYRREAKKYLNKSKNFFKHADEDPNGEHEFPLVINDYVLFLCIVLMQEMSIPQKIEHIALSWWYICNHRELINEDFLNIPEKVFMGGEHMKKKFWCSILKRFTTRERFLKWLESLSTKSAFQQRQEMYDIFLKPYDDFN